MGAAAQGHPSWHQISWGVWQTPRVLDPPPPAPPQVGWALAGQQRAGIWGPLPRCQLLFCEEQTLFWTWVGHSAPRNSRKMHRPH